MRRIAPFAGVAALALLLTVPGASSERLTSGVRGSVLDATCYGPCQIDQKPEPYTGPDAHVVIRALPERSVVARRAPKQGHFRVRLAPGLYKVRAYVQDSTASRVMDCWQGEAKRVRVRKNRFRRVRLHVANVCIV
jgi:hypothetical protein